MKRLFLYFLFLILLSACSQNYDDVEWIEVVVQENDSLWLLIDTHNDHGDIRRLVHMYEEENQTVVIHPNQKIKIPVIQEQSEAKE